MKKTSHAVRRIAVYFAVLFAMSMAVSCEMIQNVIHNDDPNKSKEVEQLTEDQANEKLCELMSRSIVLGLLDNCPVEEVDQFWSLFETMAGQIETKGYPGVWGQIKSLYDFDVAVMSTNEVHRATLIGVMSKCGETSKASRDQIYERIIKTPGVPDYCKVGSDKFWTKFSMGEFDRAAVNIYHAVISERLESGDTPAQRVANYMDYNNLREIDMMRKCAGTLIEAGANVIFAFGNDLIQNGKLAYDFVNVHGELVLQAVEGNLTSEKCIDVLNFNLKLLTKGLEEVIPTSQNLTEVLADLSAEQIKALQKEIEQTLRETGNYQLDDKALEWFEYRAKQILGLDWKVDFADKTFYNKDDLSEIIFHSNANQAYTFNYSDKDGNTLIEGKCSITQRYISVRVDVKAKGAEDLLPRGRTITLGDIISIPYRTYDDGWGGTEVIDMWSDGGEQYSKMFHLKVEHDPVTATPNPVNFEKDGGSQALTIDVNTFKFFGATPDKACKDWLTVSGASRTNVSLKASENKTGKARSGILYVWGTDIEAAAEAMRDDPDPIYVEGSQSGYVAVTVAQDAGSKTPKITEITFVRFNFETNAKTTLSWTYDGGGSMNFYEMTYNWHREWQEMTFSQSGTTLTVQAHDTHHSEDTNLSMDWDYTWDTEIIITGFEEPYDNCKVQTATYRTTSNGKAVKYPDQNWQTDASATNVVLNSIPLEEKRMYTSSGEFTFSYRGIDNVKVSSYNNTDHSTTKDGHSQDRDHSYDPSDSDYGVVGVKFKFE